MTARHAARYAASPAPAVFTWVDPTERPRVDAAGNGVYRALHHESVDALYREVRRTAPAAVVMSVGRPLTRHAPGVARLVREFPRVPMVALLSRLDQATPHAVLDLANCGVRTLVDVRDSDGWHRLREFIAREAVGDIDRLALAMLRDELDGATDDCWKFFEALFHAHRPAPTVRALAHAFGVLPSTLMSRFFRARLPAPKRYLAWARLIRAARLLENPGLSIANAANQLEYSSAQSFGRHVKTLLGVTAGEFRRAHDGMKMLNRFRDELLRPHRDQLRQLRPITGRPLGRPVAAGTL
ncbi:MAG: helix-turn-helix transcriptional regulator [Gemmatimonadaceae bacterium]|nr:helix-turn-helix transcriptional regulator [Gemmatimonadaceae bacterium]